jgi:four helix bundle protein
VPIRNYTDLIAWQKAIALVVAVYQVSAALPVEERYGLLSQMRRAAVAVPSNIAEGQGRRTDGESLNLRSAAQGSLGELETQLTLCGRLELLQPQEVTGLLEQAGEVDLLRVSRMPSRSIAADCTLRFRLPALPAAGCR